MNYLLPLFVKYLNIKYVQINEDYYGNRKRLPLSDSFFNKDATVTERPYWGEGGRREKTNEVPNELLFSYSDLKIHC